MCIVINTITPTDSRIYDFQNTYTFPWAYVNSRISGRSNYRYDFFACELSGARLFATPWTVAGQASLSMEFWGQEYWSGLSFPSPGALPDPGIEPMSPVSLALAGRFFTTCHLGSLYIRLLSYYFK